MGTSPNTAWGPGNTQLPPRVVNWFDTGISPLSLVYVPVPDDTPVRCVFEQNIFTGWPPYDIGIPGTGFATPFVELPSGHFTIIGLSFPGWQQLWAKTLLGGFAPSEVLCRG